MMDQSNREERIHAAKQLCIIAEAMEGTEPGSKERKELSREYAIYAKTIFPTEERKKHSLPESKIQKSKDDCYTKIIAALDDLPAWEESIKKIHIGELGHIAFSYNINHEHMPYEIQFMIVHHFYSAYSGYKAVKNRVNLVSAKQLDGYGSLEYGLLRFTLDFIRGARREWFVKKYALPYNEKIKAQKKEAKNSDGDDRIN